MTSVLDQTTPAEKPQMLCTLSLKRHRTIPIFTPEMACPHRCVYCNQYHISGQQHVETPDQITQKIEQHLATISDAEVEIGFFGGSFTGLPIEEQRKYLQLAQPFIRSGKVTAIRLSTRPDYITRENLQLLKEHHVRTIELGAQSLDDHVLQTSQRGHNANDVCVASRLIKDFGFRLGLQMMVGLPNDTPEKAMQTAKKIIALHADDTRIYPAVVVRNTLMEQWYKQGIYAPLSLPDAVRQVANILPLFEHAHVQVIRVGLHPSEGLMQGTDMVAGPFHVSFRELVWTEIWSDILAHIPSNKQHALVVSVSPKEINYAVGYDSKNKNALMQRFASVQFKTDESLHGRNLKIAQTTLPSNPNHLINHL